MTRCLVAGPARVGYRDAWDLQARLLERRVAGAIPDVLLLVEHPPVITLGRRARAEHLVASEEELRAGGFTVHEVDRGGDITYHGPGQITGYPILHLDDHGRDLHRYLRRLEECLIATLREYGVAGERVEGLTGVWVGGAKVAALGVKVRRWVTMHGFAFNVSCDLSHFRTIIPCGIQDKPVTSLEVLLGEPADLGEVSGVVAARFLEEFGLEEERVSLDDLRALAPPGDA